MLDGDKNLVADAVLIQCVSELIGALSFEIIPAK
jgi:hypothetical protein